VPQVTHAPQGAQRCPSHPLGTAPTAGPQQSPLSAGNSPQLWKTSPKETDDTDSDIQMEDPLFIRKLHFIPLPSCPRAPAPMLIR